jgi:hydroxymethylbilane synthase
MSLRIATRGSKLALAQSEWIKRSITGRHPDLPVELVRIKTKGDKIVDSPLTKIGGKGLFVKEIEEALLNREADLAVHSLKDMPAELPPGLKLAAFPEREDSRDAFISVRHPNLEDLPQGARVGTGSLRRSAQLRHLRPDIAVVPLRGNVDTRLSRLDAGDFDAIILAAAGLKRLGLVHRISQLIPRTQILPAIGQGALGLEVRSDDAKTRGLLGFLNHRETELTIKAERAFLEKMEGGCEVPMAALCRIEGNQLDLCGMVAELDGSNIIRDRMTGELDSPEDLGVSLARRLLASGADRVLAEIYGADRGWCT